MTAHDRRTPVAWVLVGGPLAMAVLAVAQAATLGSGWLSSGSDTADALLLGFSLLVIIVSALMGSWQHRAIVRPLRELARSAGRRHLHGRGLWRYRRQGDCPAWAAAGAELRSTRA